jgi:YceI-like domain
MKVPLPFLDMISMNSLVPDCKRHIHFKRQSVITLFIIAFLFFFGMVYAANVYIVKTSKVRFKSEAPLETIIAESSELKGMLDLQSKNFAFTVNNESFKGFNSPLQREHFNDNYLDTDKYPVISYTGRIIDEIDFNKPGTYNVRAKGMMNVKGINRERLIKSVVEVKPNSIKITSEFTVLLDDYSIRIPRVVNQKIAPEIQITFSANLEPQK